MGQAKLRGTLVERMATAAGRPPKETKAEARHREMLERRDVPQGCVGVALHEKGVLVAVHHFAAEEFAEGRAIAATAVVSKMKGILKGDPATDERAFHYLRHAGLDRLRARQHIGFGFLLWTVVNDPQAGQAVMGRIGRELAENGRAALMLTAVEGSLTMAVGAEFPDLENPAQAEASDARMVETVPLSYSLR
jgi:hypothetical protein